jgi:hypothetical protein
MKSSARIPLSDYGVIGGDSLDPALFGLENLIRRDAATAAGPDADDRTGARVPALAALARRWLRLGTNHLSCPDRQRWPEWSVESLEEPCSNLYPLRLMLTGGRPVNR